MGTVKKNELQIRWNEEGNRYRMQAEGTPMRNPEEADFFRIMMDDGYCREMAVPSHLQKGTVTVENDRTVIFYPRLVGADGRVFQVELTVTVEEKEGELRFSSKVCNKDEARVNEVQLPFLDFGTVCDEHRENDVLYRTRGMGERVRDPWKEIEKSHTEYMAADYHEIWSPLMYPRPASMAWMGLESGGKFLYMGREDQPYHTCTLNVGCNPRGTDSRLILSVCHYPLVLQGETICTAEVAVSLTEGDWRDGSERYRRWADSSWYTQRKRPGWIRDLTGWQRIILRHQYGEAFWKYRDLPQIWEDGRKYGINTLMVFGWWKGRFDNGYPLYEPDDALGGEEELKAAIREIQHRGGKVILYTNGVLMDVKSDFYQECGADVATIDLDGNPYMDHYQFSNQGTILRTFGYKTFAHACQGTEEWKQRLLHNGRVKQSMKPDSLFFDQLGGHRSELCFNRNHKHGNRGDLDPQYRVENIRALNELLGEEEALGTEFTVDIYDPYLDYHHGCDYGNWHLKNVYPQLYLNTFPDTVLTNRLIHDEREDYKMQLNYALVCGYRFDVSIYRGRRIHMDGVKGYAEQVKRLLEFKEKYRRFFYPSKFRITELPDLPEDVMMTEYVCGEERLVMLLNCKTEKRNVLFHKTEYEIPGYGVLALCGDEVEVVE